MLLGQLNLNLLQYLSVIALETSIQTSITIHNDEAELVIVLKQDVQRLGLELAAATVYVLVDGLEGLEVVVDHLFGAPVVHEDLTAEDHQTVLGRLVVVLKLAQCGLYSRLYRVLCLRALNLGCLTEFFLQLRCDKLNVLAGGDVERDERCAVTLLLI